MGAKSDAVSATAARTKRARTSPTPARSGSSDTNPPAASASAAAATLLVPLLEPLEQYRLSTLRTEVKRLQLKVTWKGPGCNDHKRGLIELIREHWRGEERARTQAAARMGMHVAVGRDDDDPSYGDGESENDCEPHDVHASAYASAVDARYYVSAGASPHMLVSPRSSGSIVDLEVAALQCAYWASQYELARQKLATAQLEFAIQHAKLRDEQLGSTKRKIAVLRNELACVDASSVVAAEITNELRFYVSEKRRLLRALEDKSLSS